MKKNTYLCPICGQYELNNEYDICNICFWENDYFQLNHPDERGANFLSLNDYKKWWNALESIMPKLLNQYEVKQGNNHFWKYDDLIVPHDNMNIFINEMTKHNISLRANFYFLCDEYNLNKSTFVGFPLMNLSNPKEINEELLNLIFSNDPVNVCTKYQMDQVLQILNNSQNVNDKWNEIMPHIDINIPPNPMFIPIT